MAEASRDQNYVPTLLGVSNADGVTPVKIYADPVTHRLLVDGTGGGGGSGTVTSVSVVSANGFAGSVATATTTPAITLSTTITGILQGNGTAISAATTTGSGSVVLATSPTLTTPNIGAATGTSLTLGGVSVPTISSTSTITNKRVQPRTASSTTSSNLSPDLSTANVYFRTTQTATLTIDAPIGTPVIGETIMIYVDSAGAQTLTINATYIPFGAAFPATTTAGKTFMMSCQYNGTNWKTLWANAV